VRQIGVSKARHIRYTRVVGHLRLHEDMKSLFVKIQLLLTICFTSFGQQNVTGRVIDSETKKPIKEVKVTIKGTTINTTSNSLGFFQLLTDTTNHLLLEKDGYEIGQIKVPPSNSFQIRLKKIDTSNIINVDNEYEKGTIKEGYKIGIWEYYDNPAKLSLRVDYNSGRLLYQMHDSLNLHTIEINNQWIQSMLDVEPRYIGSMVEFYKIFNSNVKFPKEALRKKTIGTFHIIFEVDTTGQAINYEAVDDIGDNCSEETIKALQLIPNVWSVAIKDGKKYKSRFIIPVKFRITEDGKDIGRINKKSIANPVKLPNAWKLNELTVTAVGVTRKSY